MKPTAMLWLPAIFAVLCCVISSTRADISLLPNPRLEGEVAGKLPPDWEPLVIGAPADFTTDTAEKHGGQSSVRIDAPDFTRSYIRSAEMTVVPGEEIRGSAWIKVKDVPPDHGTVIMIAEFVDPTGQDATVEKFNVADLRNEGWQKIEGSVKVPQNAVTLRLRLGFSYAKGTCWWDDIVIAPKSPLVARIDLSEPRLSPAMKTVPVLIANRTGSRERVKVKVDLNKLSGELPVTLDGKPVQKVDVPVKMPAYGKVAATVTLLPEKGSQPIFSANAAFAVPPAIVLPPVSPTHWVIEDGPARIEGRVDLALSDAIRNGATLRMQVRDASGKTIAGWTHNGAIPDGLIEFTIDAKEAKEGNYTLVAELRPASGKVFSAEQAWAVIPRRLAEVTINAEGFCEHDGKAIFPLGIFNGAKFKEQADAGFTVTHAYNAARIFPGPRPQDQAAKDYLDKTEANGMKMVLMVPMRLVIRSEWDAVRRRVRMFRNHPGLLAWDEEEGFARGDFSADTLTTLRRLLLEEDPNHPFMVGDARSLAAARNTDRSNFFPVDEMDLGMWWWYPFPLKARAANALEGEDASSATEIPLPTFLTQATTTKPIWSGVQSYKKGGSRYPTPEEYRCQAYLGIALGAKGLMWYGGSVTGGLYLGAEEGHLPALFKVVRELRDLSPTLVTPPLEKPTVAPAEAPINVTLRHSADRLVLIAVNRSTREVDATIASPRIKAGLIAVVYEDRRVEASDGQLKDHFSPFAAHVYELPRQAP